MITQQNTNPGHAPIGAKWFGLVNNVIIPLPSRRVAAPVIRAQAFIAEGDVLCRDHDDPKDEIIAEKTEVDLGLGNVFYSESCSCEGSDGPCPTPAKLAFAVDDRPELTIRGEQTGKTLRELFNISEGRKLLRDLECPVDEPIRDDQPVLFGEGPVFVTRPLAEYCINIEVH